MGKKSYQSIKLYKSWSPLSIFILHVCVMCLRVTITPLIINVGISMCLIHWNSALLLIDYIELTLHLYNIIDTYYYISGVDIRREYRRKEKKRHFYKCRIDVKKKSDASLVLVRKFSNHQFCLNVFFCFVFHFFSFSHTWLTS